MVKNYILTLVSGINPERAADILIFLDASAGKLGSEFEKCAQYAQTNNLLFPKITYDHIDQKTISIFKDKNNPLTPLVIYMPRISDHQLWKDNMTNPDYQQYNLSGFNLEKETNNGFCATQHFQYSQEHSTLVANQTEFNMRVNQKAIIDAINWKIDNTTLQ